MLKSLLSDDLEHILIHTQGFWEELRGKRLFITGGTGFFGCWLLESFAWANERLRLDASALVLTRNRDLFEKCAPHLASNPAIDFHLGDVRDFIFPSGEFSHIIHAAATSAAVTFNSEDQLVMFDTIVDGTRHVLDFAVKCQAKKILFTSSGAVYGKQPPTLTHLPEDYCGAPKSSDLGTAWVIAKLAAEFLCSYYAHKYSIEIKVARCFSFVGPYLPLDIHYAIGNFIRDGLSGQKIKINGDGTPCRSYLYAADLAIWLWVILFKGEPCGVYNVGSEQSVSISELAHTVAGCFENSVEIIIAKEPEPNKFPDRYIPLTKRAQLHLGLKQYIDLKTSIERTIAYNLKCNKS